MKATLQPGPSPGTSSSRGQRSRSGSYCMGRGPAAPTSSSSSRSSLTRRAAILSSITESVAEQGPGTPPRPTTPKPGNVERSRPQATAHHQHERPTALPCQHPDQLLQDDGPSIASPWPSPGVIQSVAAAVSVEWMFAPQSEHVCRGPATARTLYRGSPARMWRIASASALSGGTLAAA